MDTIAARMPLTPLRARSRWRMPTPAEVLKHGKGNLQERDIIISEAKVDLTKGDQNPMDNVSFFDYPESTEKKTVPRHHISAMFPECNPGELPTAALPASQLWEVHTVKPPVHARLILLAQERCSCCARACAEPFSETASQKACGNLRRTSARAAGCAEACTMHRRFTCTMHRRATVRVGFRS